SLFLQLLAPIVVVLREAMFSLEISQRNILISYTRSLLAGFKLEKTLIGQLRLGVLIFIFLSCLIYLFN
ncbi:hypothetical protein ACJX0J_038043, partial [Zea mays]